MSRRKNSLKLNSRSGDLELTIRVVKEKGQPEMYVIQNGVRIAKRGHPGTPQAMTWISLEPGWVVRDDNYPHGIEVEYVPVMVM